MVAPRREGHWDPTGEEVVIWLAGFIALVLIALFAALYFDHQRSIQLCADLVRDVGDKAFEMMECADSQPGNGR